MTYRLPLVTAILIFVQMVMGGVVVGKDAGFICPDWPLCHGQVLPQLTGLVILELVHRATAVLVTLLVLYITVKVWRTYKGNRFMVGVASLTVVSLLVQCVVGGMIVLFKLPGITTTIDVANSMFLLGLYVTLIVELRHHQTARGADEVLAQLAPTARRVLGVGGLAVVVGAVFRHTGASEALFGVNHYLASHGQLTPPSMQASSAMLAVHVVTGLAVAVSSLWFYFRAAQVRRLRKSSMLLLALVAVQMILGIVSLQTKLGLIPSTLHFTGAGALIATMTWMVITTQIAARSQAVAMQGAGGTTLHRPGAVHR